MIQKDSNSLLNQKLVSTPAIDHQRQPAYQSRRNRKLIQTFPLSTCNNRLKKIIQPSLHRALLRCYALSQSNKLSNVLSSQVSMSRTSLSTLSSMNAASRCRQPRKWSASSKVKRRRSNGALSEMTRRKLQKLIKLMSSSRGSTTRLSVGNL